MNKSQSRLAVIHFIEAKVERRFGIAGGRILCIEMGNEMASQWVMKESMSLKTTDRSLMFGVMNGICLYLTFCNNQQNLTVIP